MGPGTGNTEITLEALPQGQQPTVGTLRVWVELGQWEAGLVCRQWGRTGDFSDPRCSHFNVPTQPTQEAELATPTGPSVPTASRRKALLLRQLAAEPWNLACFIPPRHSAAPQCGGRPGCDGCGCGFGKGGLMQQKKQRPEGRPTWTSHHGCDIEKWVSVTSSVPRNRYTCS